VLDKNCTKCNKIKSIKNFNFKYKAKGIRQSHCRDCKKEYLKAHYIKNIDAYKEKSKRFNAIYKKKRRIAVLELKMSNPCNICGEADPRVLEFDHIDHKAKNHSIANMVSRGGYSIKNVFKEILKCQVLCANCHRRKTACELGFYSTLKGEDNET
jgi:hypothetical protein